MILAGVFPLLFLSLSIVRSGREMVLGMNGLTFGALIIVAGFTIYVCTPGLRRARGQNENVDTH